MTHQASSKKSRWKNGRKPWTPPSIVVTRATLSARDSAMSCGRPGHHPVSGWPGRARGHPASGCIAGHRRHADHRPVPLRGRRPAAGPRGQPGAFLTDTLSQALPLASCPWACLGVRICIPSSCSLLVLRRQARTWLERALLRVARTDLNCYIPPCYCDVHGTGHSLKGFVMPGLACLQVTLTIRPHGQQSTKQVALTREKITFDPVSSQLCSSSGSSSSADGNGSSAASPGSGKTGYIRLATFSKQTPENTRAAIQKLKLQGADR